MSVQVMHPAPDSPRILSEIGINWEFLYEVLYEDEVIICLKDLGRFHRFDEDRKFRGETHGEVEIHGSGLNQTARVLYVDPKGRVISQVKMTEVSV